MSNMDFKRKVLIPKDIREQYPLSEDLIKIKEEKRKDSRG